MQINIIICKINRIYERFSAATRQSFSTAQLGNALFALVVSSIYNRSVILYCFQRTVFREVLHLFSDKNSIIHVLAHLKQFADIAHKLSTTAIEPLNLENFVNIDHDVVESLRNGHIEAFDTLYNKYASRLHKFALKYLKSNEGAEDVVQEVFMYIWNKRDGLKPDSSFNSYIFTIAYNIIKKRFIKQQRDNAYKDELIYSLLKREESLDNDIDYKMLLDKVESIVKSLPERRRIIFTKRKFDGIPIKQIAQELGISPNTVENQLTAAQKTLKEELSKEKLAGLLFFALFIAL